MIVVVCAAVLLLTAGHGSGSKEVSEVCGHTIQPALSAVQGLGSHVDAGVNQADYGQEVGDANAAFERAQGYSDSACKPVVTALGSAIQEYEAASTAWNECLTGTCPTSINECVIGLETKVGGWEIAEELCLERALQAHWNRATAAVGRAKTLLAGAS